ncbi:hypothetical protein Angca_009964, partial [Angiostrongylus cantonensis]
MKAASLLGRESMKKKNKTPNVSKQSAKREAKKEKAKAKEAKKKTKNEKQKEKIKKKVAAIRSMDLSEFAQTEQEDSSSSDEYLGSPDTPNEQRLPGVLQVSRASEKKVLPGALLTPPPLPNCYTERILQEERPDLAENGRFKMELYELDLLDKYLRHRAELQTDDVIVIDNSQNEDDRCCSRYEIQLKYNEGRYSSIYIVSKKVFGNHNGTDAANLFALKTGIRNGSANLSIRMKRELRILATMKKAKASWAPILLDSGSVCDMPFIVTNLVDMNIEKLREMIGGKFKPSSAFYIAGEVLNALVELHRHGFVHRDVKPTNICVGVGVHSSKIYLVDYGDTVRIGKNIKYGTPDGYTLPYWSVDCHRREPATQRTDFEEWFYTIGDLFVPSILTWKSVLDEREVMKAKINFWTDLQSTMFEAPVEFVSIADVLCVTDGQHKVNVERLKKHVKEGFEHCVNNARNR